MLPGLLILLAALAAPLPAQSLYLYAASETGRVSANGYPLDNLADSTAAAKDEVWHDLFVHGADRWLIRGDGKVAKNGESIQDLADDDDWRGIVVDDDGDFFALRLGGKVAGPDGVIANYDAGDFNYLDIVTDGVDVYVLRSNGAVFRVPELDPLVKFDGPPGEVDGSSGDGEASDTAWVFMAINPADGRLWALRRDGTLKSADIPADPPVDPDPGTLEASLPYDDSDGIVDQDELYKDLVFTPGGAWYALRADGKLFDEANQGPPLVDFPGEPSDDDTDSYEAVLADDADTIVLRDDGKVFRGLDTTAIIDLKDSVYFGLAVDTTFPNLDNVKNQAPVATCMTVKAPEGTDIELPVLATDRDKPAEDLVVDVDPETLPAGATWDGGARVITWPGAGPAGTYKIHVTVDDGIAKPVTAVQTIKIQVPDDNVDKNIKPVLAKVKRAVALVALPFSLPILAFDRDGDSVSVALDESKPLPDGVSFDAQESLLLWDAPLVADKGTFTFKYLVDDGTVVVTIGRKVKVDTSLLAF
jgi:hypothetical protein